MDESGEPWFCLADVSTVLGIQNHRNVKARLDEDDVRPVDIADKLGRKQQATYINQSGVYEVTVRSDADMAKPFRKWITHEVLPAINKTVGYIVAKEDDTPELIMARAVLVANETIERQKKKIAEQATRIEADAPYVDYANSIMKVDGDLDMQSVARVLADNNIKDDHGKPIGRKYLFKVLRQNFILMSDRRPYQKYVDKTYFGCYVHRIDTGWGEKVTYVPTVTPKGLKWLLEQIDKGKLKRICRH